MTITATERTSIINLTVGMFNAAPGGIYLSDLTLAYIANGRSLTNLGRDLANTSAYKTLNPVFQTASEFAAAFLTPLGLQANTEAVTYITSRFDAGVSKGQIVAEAVAALNASTATAFATAKAILTNKTSAAEYYSVTLNAQVTSIATLQAAISTVTADVATVAAANTANSAVSGQTYTLTTGSDNFTGGNGNDTFIAGEIGGVVTWTVGDAVNGGLGTDTFNVTQTAAITVPVSATVTNIEIANLTSGTTGTVVNSTGWTGLTNLNVTGVTAISATAAATTAVAVTGTTATGAIAVNGGSTVSVTNTGASGGTVTIGGTTAAAGAVTVNSTGTTAGGTTGNAITVTGGTTVSVTQVTGNVVNTTNTAGAVTVTGNASTTAVTVNDTAARTASATAVGHVNGAVSVLDVNRASATAAGTIETVTLGSFAAATVNSGALKTLNLSGTGTSVDASTLGALTTVTNTTLALNVTGLTTTGAVTIDTDITTLNLASATTASTLNSLSAAGVKSLSVTGDAKVTLTSNTFTALTDVTVTNTAGFAMGGTALNTGATFAGGAGADAVVLGATTKAITMGAGNDRVTSDGLVGSGGSVNAGDGSDTIVMTSAQAASADDNSTFNSKFTNFEVLELSNALTGGVTLDLAGINGVTTVVLTAGGADAATSIISNLASGGTVRQTGNGTGVVVNVTNALFNPADVLNLNLSKSTVLTAGTITAAGVETVNIAAADAVSSGSAAVIHTLTLVATGATTVNVSGNNGLTLTNTGNAAITKFDASGVVANGTADTAANLAVTFTVATTGNKAVTVIGGAGNDVLTGSTVANTVTFTGGEGADILATGKGNDTFILTETTPAVDTVVFLTTANNGVDTIIGFQVGNTATSDKAQLVNAATTLANAGPTATLGGVSVALTNGAAAYVLATSTSNNDILEFNTTLSSFGNLGAAGIVDGSELLKALSSTNVAATSITATGADDDFYIVAYQSGNAYLYQVTNGADTTVAANEIFLVSTFNGIAAGAFVQGDFTVLAAGIDLTINGTAGDDTIDQGASTLNLAVNGLGGDDTITTGTGNDVITTLGGNDTITSGAGNDTINAGDGNNTITGGDGDDTITAGAGNDTITGGAGNDTITMGGGSNTITLGTGADILIFNALVVINSIADYSLADDSIQLSKAIFTGLGVVGPLGAGEFFSGAGAITATDGLQRIIYNTSDGTLRYDADGNGGGSTAVLIGTFTGAPGLVVGEFSIIA